MHGCINAAVLYVDRRSLKSKTLVHKPVPCSEEGRVRSAVRPKEDLRGDEIRGFGALDSI